MRRLIAAILLAAPLGARAAPSPTGQDPESDRLELIFALEQKPSPSQIPILLQTLGHHPSANARAEAARALALKEYRTDSALEALSRAMSADASVVVRRQAALSALAYDGHEAVAPLEDFLKSEKADTLRRELAVALATAPLHLDDSEATAALAALLEDADPVTRETAARSLGARGDTRAVSALRRAADKDPEKPVRRAAKDALAALSRRREK
jgi:HEAT repeat protein